MPDDVPNFGMRNSGTAIEHFLQAYDTSALCALYVLGRCDVSVHAAKSFELGNSKLELKEICLEQFAKNIGI